MTLLLALLLAAPFPSSSRTTWMRPEPFHLTIGMTHDAALEVLRQNGWKTKSGAKPDQLEIDYSDERTVTLRFTRGRLKSIRFELFAFLPEIRKAFDEEKATLRGELGAGKATKSIVLYDKILPNVMVVLSPDTKKGIGMLSVEYFDPAR